jgi:hypothetical protein
MPIGGIVMRLIYYVGLFLVTGCAMTYERPAGEAPVVSATPEASKAKIMAAAKRVLIGQGFQISSSDDAAGIISTPLKSARVTATEANCGSTMGIDYLKDNRTSTKVGYGILADDNKLTVTASIEGEYKVGSVSNDVALTCISTGHLERMLMSKITGSIR